MSNLEYGLIMQEVERADSGLRSFVSVQGALVMYPIHTFGTDEQRQHWLPKLQSGEALGCFGLTEPDFGSNPAGMLTKAVADGDQWILNGEKTWITNGSLADVAVVWARTEDGIRGFLVEQGTPGFSTSDLHGKLSMRASGAAMDCYETARSYTLARKQFGDKPLAGHQLVQEKLAWMITEITKGQLLAFHVAKLKDAGKVDAAHISMLKRNNVSIALECARLSRDLLGANGIMDDYPVMRHLCNLETVKTYEGTDHIHALVIGERVTGIPAYR
jgi:glutaryl-CoA dehydrogenase